MTYLEGRNAGGLEGIYCWWDGMETVVPGTGVLEPCGLGCGKWDGDVG